MYRRCFAEHVNGWSESTILKVQCALKKGGVMNRFISSIGALLVLSASMVGEGAAGQAMNAEFGSMGECLTGIKNSSRQSLKIITDTSSEVSGVLSNGQGFACQRKISGTKGTYYHGWYTVE